MIHVVQDVNTPKDFELELPSVNCNAPNETDVDNLSIPEEKLGTLRHREAFPSNTSHKENGSNDLEFSDSNNLHH